MKKGNDTGAFLRVVLLMAALTAFGSLSAQVKDPAKDAEFDQDEACPGWNNPMDFMQGDASTNYQHFFYSGQTGEKVGSGQCNNFPPSALTGVTGFTSVGAATGTWNNTPNVTNAQLQAGVTINGNYDHAAFPDTRIGGFPFPSVAQNIGYAIYDSMTTVGSYQRNIDPNTGTNGLPFVPTHFNTHDTTPGVVNTNLVRSIRIGDAYGNHQATALYYNMKVNSQNAMLYIYYSTVIESPASGSSQTVHGKNCDPAFIIRVMKKDGNGNWIQANPVDPTSNVMDDRLTYMVSSTPHDQQGWSCQSGYGGFGSVDLGTGSPWHIYTGGTPSGTNGSFSSYKIFWKEWDKVALNLSPLYGQDVRIEVMVSDCCMTQHFAYGYVCGECRPMVIPSTGCPAGRSQDVTVLNAPRGLRSYVWQASEFGVSDPISDLYPSGNPSAPNPNEYFTFRTVSQAGADSTEAAGAQSYHVQANDFRVLKKRLPSGAIVNLPDSIGNRQTFRCRMRSALDPDKPFESYMYANVTNLKPKMQIDSVLMCGGDVTLTNQSSVPGAAADAIDLESTTWKFYNTSNPTASTPMVFDTVHSGVRDTVHFEGDTTRYVLVRSYAVVDAGQPACYSEAVYPIKPKMNPKTGMHITHKTVCLDSLTTLYDTTTIYVDENHPKYARWWIRRKATAPEDNYTLLDTIWHTQSLPISNFTHREEPVELWVRNGQFYTNPTVVTDTIWCKTGAYDTVHVFTHPQINKEGDSIVCKGTKTHITATAVDIDSCEYHWYTTLYGTNAISSDSLLEVTPVNDTTTYYVKVTSPMGCDAWDSARAFLITPALEIRPADGRSCPDDEVKLIGKNAASYTWTADPPDPTLDGQDSADIITVSPDTTTVYTMVGHGTNGCNATPLTQTVTVYPYAIPKIRSNPPMVDTDDPTVTLYNESTYSVNATWTFENGDVLTGNEVEHTFEEATGQDSVYLTLTPVNELDCPSVPRRFGIPVNLYTIWLPTIFTPGSEDDNAVFRMYTINDYELFHIYIYNRRGELVFDSTDPEFVWDGTCNGVACPQGAYVYICRYRKPGMLTLAEKYGTVTMIR